jgi:hypothetical protein
MAINIPFVNWVVKPNLNYMASAQSIEDNEIPSLRPVFTCAWHEKRIAKLEDAFLGVSTTLLPTVSRLEEKTDGLHRFIREVKEDIGGFRSELTSLNDKINTLATGNITRDIIIKDIQATFLSRKERHWQIIWGACKMIGAIIATVTGTLLIVWFKLK